MNRVILLNVITKLFAISNQIIIANKFLFFLNKLQKGKRNRS